MSLFSICDTVINKGPVLKKIKERKSLAEYSLRNLGFLSCV